jgi:hypothetical protein
VPSIRCVGARTGTARRTSGTGQTERAGSVALNSATAVQNALVPSIPADIASRARRYITTTLDQTTAAMGNTPTSDVNRSNDQKLWMALGLG